MTNAIEIPAVLHLKQASGPVLKNQALNHAEKAKKQGMTPPPCHFCPISMKISKLGQENQFIPIEIKDLRSSESAPIAETRRRVQLHLEEFELSRSLSPQPEAPRSRFASQS